MVTNGFKIKKKIDVENKKIKGKNFDSLLKSRIIRQDLKNKIGCIPTSILKNTREKRIDIITDNMGGGYNNVLKKNFKELRKKFPGSGIESAGAMSFTDIGGKGKEFLSAFPQNIGRIITEIYCPEDGIVYDCFAGHNSRMELVFKCSRNYVGVDVSKKFMTANRKIRKILLDKKKSSFFSKNKKDTFIHLIEGSSAKVKLPNDYADFTITSPPYWNIEYYGDEPEQLGNAKTYERFLELLFEHVKENYRILKKGSFACWFINDFRKNKIFYAYHMDMYNLLLKAGFEPYNVYIVDLSGSIGGVYAQNIVKYKLFPKAHEYCLIFKK